MAVFTVTEARTKLQDLIDEVASSHKPVIIKGEKSKAILISEDDCRSAKLTV